MSKAKKGILLGAFLFLSSVCSMAFATSAQQLANYIGTGRNPNIHLELSANGPNWAPYNINYKSVGNVPWSTNSKTQWSSWNVKDQNGNYYGTITLNSDGNTVT